MSRQDPDEIAVREGRLRSFPGILLRVLRATLNGRSQKGYRQVAVVLDTKLLYPRWIFLRRQAQRRLRRSKMEKAWSPDDHCSATVDILIPLLSSDGGVPLHLTVPGCW